MRDLDQRLAEARSFTPDISDAGIELAIAGGRRRQRRQRRLRSGLASLLFVCALGAGWYRFGMIRPTLSFSDGSTATRLDRDTAMQIAQASPTQIEVKLERGGGRFDVARNPQRVFRVIAGDVKVEVLGTRFTVERELGHVLVRVERGRVRVTSRDGERLLGVGEEATFPGGEPPIVEPPAAPVAAHPVEPETVVDPSPAPIVFAPIPVHAHWRAAAEKGNYEVAYRQLKEGGPRAVRDVPEELMMAADVARWSHHPAAAVPLLERVVRDHGRDPRAQLAAFTLGRVLLEELGHPREAARAFGRARALDARGPLSADALAREVEAWSRADDGSQARERAEQYLHLYPRGAHLAAVRRFGAIE